MAQRTTGESPDYTAIVAFYKQRYGIRVRRWRRTMSGCAWRALFRDGRTANWIESPRPKTTLSLAIFLHEVGHHAIGFDKYPVGCVEEYHVWCWAIEQLRFLQIDLDARVKRRFQLSMQYAVSKAVRRGLKHVPEDLLSFLPRAA